MFDTSEGTISAPIATHTVTIPTYSWEKTDTQETVVPKTPELELASWMESQSSVLPETPDLEAISKGFDLQRNSFLRNFNSVPQYEKEIIFTSNVLSDSWSEILCSSNPAIICKTKKNIDLSTIGELIMFTAHWVKRSFVSLVLPSSYVCISIPLYLAIGPLTRVVSEPRSVARFEKWLLEKAIEPEKPEPRKLADIIEHPNGDVEIRKILEEQLSLLRE
ncbi:hypothetical protein SASPL_104913 [Salvia splendens]|uniref:Uncharacterized protein n=1 Tax=Salvia splendens TaxID=180675 RepID=A0A8X8YI31_SALSN|nr:hypothetical protein SASPL_104913 [Salvia splendens]